MISVVIPLYNKEIIIEKSLNSVLSQDYSDFELIVVDDGSTDGSVAIVEKIFDNRIHLIRQKNSGPSKARNVGVQYAKGDWILFLDADDEMQPGALRCFSNYISKVPKADMFIGEVLFDTNGVVTNGCNYKEGYVKNVFKAHLFDCLTESTGSMIYRKELCVEFPFDEKLRRYEDLKVLFELYRRHELYLCPYTVVKINQSFSSASNARKDINEDFLSQIVFKGKSFWEKMCLFAFFVGERTYYDNDCRRLYSTLYYRYDMLLLFKLINSIKKNRVAKKLLGLSQFV